MFWLSDSHAKVDRADEVLRDLHEEINAFVTMRPFTFRIEADPDPPKPGVNVIRVHCENPHLVELRLKRFGVLAGEIVHHLRSGLNHLVWHLVRRNGMAENPRAEFPIFLRPQDYEERARQKLRGVPPATEFKFREWQPFNGDGATDPLWRVHELDRRDKHHVLIATIGVLPVRHEYEDEFEDHYYHLRDGHLVGRLWTTEPVGTQRNHPFSVAIDADGGTMVLVSGLFDCLEATQPVLHDFNELA